MGSGSPMGCGVGWAGAGLLCPPARSRRAGWGKQKGRGSNRRWVSETLLCGLGVTGGAERGPPALTFPSPTGPSPSWCTTAARPWRTSSSSSLTPPPSLATAAFRQPKRRGPSWLAHPPCSLGLRPHIPPAPGRASVARMPLHSSTGGAFRGLVLGTRSLAGKKAGEGPW